MGQCHQVGVRATAGAHWRAAPFDTKSTGTGWHQLAGWWPAGAALSPGPVVPPASAHLSRIQAPTRSCRGREKVKLTSFVDGTKYMVRVAFL